MGFSWILARGFLEKTPLLFKSYSIICLCDYCCAIVSQADVQRLVESMQLVQCSALINCITHLLVEAVFV